MDQINQRDLKILTEIAERQDITQRGLSSTLGIALGLTNLYLKRLARKGYIKITTIPSNRLKYLVTPKGIAQKTRLTYEYMSFSLTLYRQTRERLRDGLRRWPLDGLKRVALYGTGEAAELAYLTLKEFGVEPMAVFADTGETSFLGLPVRETGKLADAAIDRLVVASFRPLSRREQDRLQRLVPSDKLIFLARDAA